jgi:hypothetical protein
MAGQILDGDSRRIETEKVSEVVLVFCELAFRPEYVINDACCVEWERRNRGTAGRGVDAWKRCWVKSRPAWKTGWCANARVSKPWIGGGCYYLTGDFRAR